MEEWRPNRVRNDEKWQRFADTAEEIREIVGEISRRANDQRLDEKATRNGARRASVALRKLLLEGNIREMVRNPRCHRLKRVETEQRFGMTMEATIRWVPEVGESRIIGIMKDKDELYDLPGCTHAGEGVSRWNMSSEIFDTTDTRMGLKLDRWLKQRIVEIGSGDEVREYSLENLVRYVANTEGAHAETTGKGRKREGWLEMFGSQSGITYPQWINLSTAVYIIKRIDRGIQTHTREWQKAMGKAWDPNEMRIEEARLEAKTPELSFRSNFTPISIRPGKTEYGFMIRAGKDARIEEYALEEGTRRLIGATGRKMNEEQNKNTVSTTADAKVSGRTRIHQGAKHAVDRVGSRREGRGKG